MYFQNSVLFLRDSSGKSKQNGTICQGCSAFVTLKNELFLYSVFENKKCQDTARKIKGLTALTRRAQKRSLGFRFMEDCPAKLSQQNKPDEQAYLDCYTARF